MSDRSVHMYFVSLNIHTIQDKGQNENIAYRT